MGGISKQDKGCSLTKRECENPNIIFGFRLQVNKCGVRGINARMKL